MTAISIQVDHKIAQAFRSSKSEQQQKLKNIGDNHETLIMIKTLIFLESYSQMPLLKKVMK